MQKIIIIVGPTAVGKTALSLALAGNLKTEIISADSVQIYKDLDIGSAKPTHDEMGGIPHHLIDCVAATETFSVSDYAARAKAEIRRLHEAGNIPIVVGGTGLYVNSLIYDMNFGASPSDEVFRLKMEDLAKIEGNMAVHNLLSSVDPVASARIHPNNLKRVIRALEVNHITGKPFANFALEPSKTKDYEVILVCLTRPREDLYARINERVTLMIEAGLIEEVKKLKNSGLDDSFQSMQGIGYKEVLSYLDGLTTYDEMVDRVRQGSRNYAKRQMTWFKRYDGIHFIDLQEVSNEEALREILSNI